MDDDNMTGGDERKPEYKTPAKAWSKSQKVGISLTHVQRVGISLTHVRCMDACLVGGLA